MTVNALIDAVDKQAWLGRLADTVAPWLRDAFSHAGESGARLKSALNGVWLGHQLHPAMTDVPIGAWTTALVLDGASAMTDRKDLATAATVAMGAGVVGALGAAVTGVTDWSDTDGRARRIGLMHGLLNVTATSLYVSALFARRSRPTGGRRLALLGYAIATASAYLGGDLVYHQQIGVTHASTEWLPEEFTPVMADAELGEGEMKTGKAGEVSIVLLRRGGRIYAMFERCSHLGGPLGEGTLEGDTVVCPWHGSRFAFGDGHVVNGPATNPQPCLAARVRNGQIEVKFPPEPIERQELPAEPARPSIVRRSTA